MVTQRHPIPLPSIFGHFICVFGRGPHGTDTAQTLGDSGRIGMRGQISPPRASRRAAVRRSHWGPGLGEGVYVSQPHSRRSTGGVGRAANRLSVGAPDRLPPAEPADPIHLTPNRAAPGRSSSSYSYYYFYLFIAYARLPPFTNRLTDLPSSSCTFLPSRCADGLLLHSARRLFDFSFSGPGLASTKNGYWRATALLSPHQLDFLFLPTHPAWRGERACMCTFGRPRKRGKRTRNRRG